jgi:hypothetical protein
MRNKFDYTPFLHQFLEKLAASGDLSWLVQRAKHLKQDQKKAAAAASRASNARKR